MKGRVKNGADHPLLTSPLKVEEFQETPMHSIEEFF
jgi:hypothetical protein